jgi:hypothetical protein
MKGVNQENEMYLLCMKEEALQNAQALFLNEQVDLHGLFH